MSRPLLEKYEQMLEQDPTSTVFVELARALLDKGSNDRAITICQQGVTHHPESVVGRVLWGKALINVGRAAEAMSQFDLAMNINRDNPHAYNLISEVLLRKGLYRSALPILRKACVLQPNDGRIKQWLDQTKAALAGGPPPVLSEVSLQAPTTDSTPIAPGPVTNTDTVAAEPSDARARSSAARTVTETGAAAQGATGESPALDVFSAFDTAKTDPQEEPTVVMGAYDPSTGQTMGLPPISEAPTQNHQRPGPPVPSLEIPAVAVRGSQAGRPTAEMPFTVEPIRTRSQEDLPLIEGRVTQELPASGEAPDPFDSIASRSGPNGSSDVLRGLTSTFSALEAGAAPLPGPPPAPPAPSAPRLTPNPAEPSVIPAAELLLTPARSPGGGNGLLEDVASMQNEIPTGEIGMGPERRAAPAPAHPAPRPAPLTADGRKPLLEDIPDGHNPFEPPSSVEVPRVEFNTQATEAIAKEYERELRAKLEANTKKKTFLQLHGAKIAVVLGVLVIGGGLAGSFIHTRYKNKGENLDSSIGKALAAITADTKEQYVAALVSLDGALQMDDSSSKAWAWKGYAHAVLYAEHGRQPSDRDAAIAAYQHARVRDEFPENAEVVDFLIADEAGLPAARQQLLTSALDTSIVHAQAGRVLLEDKKYDDALKHLQKAVELDGKNVRALVALGDYFLAFEDYEQAVQVLEGSATQLSRYHPSRVMGLAQARLELGRDQAEALSDLEGLPKNGSVPDSMKGRYALVLGRALSVNGRHEEALKVLSQAKVENKDLAFEFEMALGAAQRNAGQMAQAQRSYEEALETRPKSEEAKDGLGRVLLARGREKEILEKLKPQKDARKVALIRGIAAARLGDSRKARAELLATQVGGKYPAEAVVYLALADAAEEQQSDKAVQMLEKLATQSRRHKATVQVALARVYMQRGALDKARAQLEEAAKDPSDYEGNALLGELLLNAGLPPEVAIEPLQHAVDRNGSHAPARHLLTRTLLAMGKDQEAAKNVEAWTADNPTLDQAWTDAALVHLRAGRVKEADAAMQKGDKLGAETVDGYRTKALVLFAKGDQKSGFAALEKANRINPKDAETFCEIGNAFVRQGNYDTAMKAYEAALREDPKSVCGTIGPHHAHPGLRGAKTALTTVLKGVNDVWVKAFVQATLARTLLVPESDVKGATSYAEEATAAQPGMAAAWFALGEVQHRLKNEPKALEAYQKGAALDGSWAGLHMALADALVRAGPEQTQAAINEYELVQQLSQNENEQSRARKWVTTLRKQLK